MAGLAFTGCASQHPEEPEILQALGATVEALQASDFDRLWELTEPDTRDQLIGLTRRIHDALQRVPEVYADLGEAQMTAARTALGAPLVDAVFPDDERAGAKLLARLLAPDLMRFDGHAMDGLGNNSVTVDTASRPMRAIVHTSAGERFAFVKTDLGWRSLLVRDLILDSGAFRTLADNLTKIEQAAADLVTRWRESRDPSTPQGTYNLARAALAESPVDAAVLFSLLDAPAREAVLTALQTSREVQREIQRRTTRRQRAKAYEDAGVAMHVEAKSDRDLYARWTRTEGWRPPLAAVDDPASVEIDTTGERSTVVTASGARVDFVRDPEGQWRIADQAPQLSEALTPPSRRPAP